MGSKTPISQGVSEHAALLEAQAATMQQQAALVQKLQVWFCSSLTCAARPCATDRSSGCGSS